MRGVKHIIPERNEKGAWVLFGGDMTLQFLDSPVPNYFKIIETFKAGASTTNKGPKSAVAPPYHLHLHQAVNEEEIFQVRQGKAVYKLDGRVGTLTTGHSVTFGPGSRHTIYPSPDSDSGSNEDVIIEGDIPSKVVNGKGVTREWLFNLNCYLSSCHAAGTRPSLIQLAVYLDRGNVALAWTGAGFFVNKVMGRWIGKSILRMRDDHYDAAFKGATSHAQQQQQQSQVETQTQPQAREARE